MANDVLVVLGGKAFGVDLSDFNILLEKQEAEVPFIIEQCCSYIFLNGKFSEWNDITSENDIHEVSLGIKSPEIFFRIPDPSHLARVEKLYNSGKFSIIGLV